jgi:hypothetical protein
MSTVFDTHIRELGRFFSDHCSNQAFYFRDKGGAWDARAASVFVGDKYTNLFLKGYSLSSNLQGYRYSTPFLADGDLLVRKDNIDGRSVTNRLSEPLASRGKIVNAIYGALYLNNKLGDSRGIPSEDIDFPRNYFGIDDSAQYTLDASKDDETGTFVFDGDEYNQGDWVSWIKIDVTNDTGKSGIDKNRDFIRITFLPFRSLEELDKELDTETDCGSCTFCGCLATWVSTFVGYFPTGIGLRADGVHMFNVIHVMKNETGIINKSQLGEMDTRFAKSNRLIVTKYTVQDGSEDEERDPETEIDENIEVLEGTFIKNEWFERFKVSGKKHSTIIDPHGTIYIFYEKSNNISVAMSTDSGNTWFDFDGIIRLKFGEVAKYPVVLSNKINDEAFVFYVFNDSFLCVKRLKMSDFIIEDAFLDYVPIVDFSDGEISSPFKDEFEDLGLEQYSFQGKVIRKTHSHVVMGNFMNRTEFDLLEEIEVSVNRKKKGLSHRFETTVLPKNFHKEFNEDIKRITYNMFIDNNGAIRLFYSLNENVFSYIDKSSCDNPEDCSLDKGCDPEGYTPADASDLGWNLFQVRKSDRSLLSWPKVLENVSLFGRLSPCDDESEEPSVHRFCRSGLSNGSYKMEFDVLYDPHISYFYVMATAFNGSLWIRRWQLDTVARIEGFRPDPCFDKSCSTSLKDQSSANFVYRNYLHINSDLADINPMTLVDNFTGAIDSKVTPAMFLTDKGRLKLYYTRNSQLISISTSSNPTIRYVD